MKIAIDAHAVGQRMGGNEAYVKNLLAHLAALNPQAELLAYVCSPGARHWLPPSLRLSRVSPNPWVRLGHDLHRRLKQDLPDLIHVQYTAPVRCPVPIVVSVHDVSFLDHPEFFPVWRRRQLHFTVKRTIQRAARIITGSRFSQVAIARAYGLPARAIDVVPNAAAPIFRPIGREAARARVRQRFGISAPFLLTVGEIQPRKNYDGLIRAFDGLVRGLPEFPHHLLIAGKTGWRGRRIQNSARRFAASSRIHFLGHVAEDVLLDLYNACDIFVFPSFYEGFGIPVLEAMACGRAVACSSTAALPEVAGSAALLFEPYSESRIASAIRDLLFYPELRRRMEKLGRRRAAQYDWKQTASKTMEIYRQVAAAPMDRAASRALLPVNR